LLILPGCKGTPPAAGEAARLSPDERRMFERFAEVYIPTEGTNLKPLSEVAYLDHIDRVLGFLDAPTLDEVHMGMKLFDYGSVVVGLHFARFANLSADDRMEYIRAWDDGVETQRAIVGTIKKLIAVGYWQDVEAARRVGYQGPVSVDAKIPSLGNAPMPAAVAKNGETP
jgi:hypothetical protein